MVILRLSEQGDVIIANSSRIWLLISHFGSSQNSVWLLQ